MAPLRYNSYKVLAADTAQYSSSIFYILQSYPPAWALVQPRAGPVRHRVLGGQIALTATAGRALLQVLCRYMYYRAKYRSSLKTGPPGQWDFLP